MRVFPQKISIRSRLILSFAAVIALVLVCQLAFNLFFAKGYYLNYQRNMMQSTYVQIAQDFDGTQESIETAVASYESQHNIEVIVWVDELVWYTSYDHLVYASGTRAPEVGQGAAMPAEGEANAQTAPSAETDAAEQVQRGQGNGVAPDGAVRVNQSELAVPDLNIDFLGDVQSEMDILHFLDTFTYGDSVVVVELARSLDSIESSTEVFSNSSMIISCLALVIGLLYSLFLSKSFTKPILEMERIAGDFANLDFSNKADEEISVTELYHLSKSLNSMSTQLEKSITSLNIANDKLKQDIDYQKQVEQMRREFVGNVSHEMKTPLTMLQIYAESLKDNIESVDKDFYCDTIIEETQIINELVGSMLDISSIESGLSKMQMEEIDLSQLLSALVARMRPLLANYHVNCMVQEGLVLNGDEKYLEQAMKNYITNAIEHTAAGGSICIALKKQANAVHYQVENEGACIADDVMPRLWDSFYRADKARSRGNKNVGLGLHIVKTVIEKHGGSCQCQNTPNGVMFSLSLPDDVLLDTE